MTVLARWYDYEVLYDEQLNESKFQQEFYGKLRGDQNIEDILQNFENLGIIKGFDIDDRRIKIK